MPLRPRIQSGKLAETSDQLISQRSQFRGPPSPLYLGDTWVVTRPKGRRLTSCLPGSSQRQLSGTEGPRAQDGLRAPGRSLQLPVESVDRDGPRAGGAARRYPRRRRPRAAAQIVRKGTIIRGFNRRILDQAAGLCHPPSYVGRQLFFGSSHRIIQGFHFCGYREELEAYGLVRRLRVNQCLEVPNEDQRLVVPVGHFVGGRRLRENLDHLRGDGG